VPNHTILRIFIHVIEPSSAVGNFHCALDGRASNFSAMNAALSGSLPPSAQTELGSVDNPTWSLTGAPLLPKLTPRGRGGEN